MSEGNWRVRVADGSRTAALITARGGSKRLKNKNILDLGGKPLIAWTVEAALGAGSVDQVLISTDDEDIAQVARQAGAQVPFMRPAELAGDTSSHLDVIRHAISHIRLSAPDVSHLVLLQPTSPFRSSQDIDAIVGLALEADVDCAVSVCEVGDHPALMYRVGEGGALESYLPQTGAYVRTQDMEPLVSLNGALYVFNIERLMQRDRLLCPHPLAYTMPTLRSLDIDTEEDLLLARALVSAGLI